MSRQLLCAGVFGVWMLGVLTSGCSNEALEPETNVADSGTLSLPLTAESGGVKYRLNKARFGIKGQNVSRVVTPPADLAVDQETLPAGKYEIALDKGWALEEKGPYDKSFSAVEATLTSANPAKFEVLRGRTVDVVFTFVTRGVNIALNSGRADIRISVQSCASFDSYSAAIAEYTVECLGTIDANAFRLTDDGILVRNFKECPVNPDVLPSIDGFLALQVIDRKLPLPSGASSPLAYAKDCIGGRWAQWKEAFDEAGPTSCPVWKKAGEVNTPEPELYDTIARGLPKFTDRGFPNPARPPAVMSLIKVNPIYGVQYPDGALPDGCKSAGDCAAQCAAGFPGFVVSVDGETVLTDPPAWQKDTVFTGPNPFTRAGYYHPMSLYGELPGEIFSHVNRTASASPPEYCSYWDGGFHIQTTLQKNCADMPDGTTGCVGVCAP